MHPALTPEERDLCKLVNYFKKRAEILIIENKLDDEYKQMLETCDKLTEQLDLHATRRAAVLEEREHLNNIIKDNAACPKCESNTHLKNIGVEKNEKGWKSNKYKCRRCNITFVWNAPNNPWDMVPYVENFIVEIELRLNAGGVDEATREINLAMLEQMKANLEKIKPIVEASDLDMKELEEREAQMSELVHKFRKHLMIEKIRMEE